MAPTQYTRIGPTPWVSTSQPRSVSIGGPQLPTCNSSQNAAGSAGSSSVRPRRCRRTRTDAGALAVGPAQADVPAADPAREHRHALVVRGRSGQALGAEGPQVRADHQPGCDLAARRRRCRCARYSDGAVVIDEAHEPGVLHARGSPRRRPASAPAGSASTSSGKRDLVGRGDHAPQHVDGGGRARTRPAAPAGTGDRLLELGRSNSSGRPRQDVVRQLVEPAQVGQDGAQVIAAHPAGRCARRRPASRAAANAHRGPGPDHRRRETDGRQVALADTAHAEGNPQLPWASPLWSGCGTALGLHSAAPSIAYSAVNVAPSTSSAVRAHRRPLAAAGARPIDACAVEQSRRSRGGGRRSRATSSAASSLDLGLGQRQHPLDHRAGPGPPARSSSPGRNSRAITRAGSGSSRPRPVHERRRLASAVTRLSRAALGLLRGRQQRQRRFGALVQVAAAGLQAVVAAAGGRVEHRRAAVVVTGEPGPGRADAVAPPLVGGEVERARARVGQRGDLDRLLVEPDRGVADAPSGHRRDREPTVPDLGARPGSPAVASPTRIGRVRQRCAGEQQRLDDGPVGVAQPRLRPRPRANRRPAVPRSLRPRRSAGPRAELSSGRLQQQFAGAEGGERHGVAVRRASARRRSENPARPVRAWPRWARWPRPHRGPTTPGPTSPRRPARRASSPSTGHPVVAGPVGRDRGQREVEVAVGQFAVPAGSGRVRGR